MRRWEERGILVPQRSEGGHRRYSRAQVEKFQKRMDVLHQAKKNQLLRSVTKVTAEKVPSFPKSEVAASQEMVALPEPAQLEPVSMPVGTPEPVELPVPAAPSADPVMLAQVPSTKQMRVEVQPVMRVAEFSTLPGVRVELPEAPLYQPLHVDQRRFLRRVVRVVLGLMLFVGLVRGERLVHQPLKAALDQLPFLSQAKSRLVGLTVSQDAVKRQGAPATKPQANFRQQWLSQVLGDTTVMNDLEFVINVPANFRQDASFAENVEIGGTLDVAGQTTLNGLTVAGQTTFTTMAVTGNITAGNITRIRGVPYSFPAAQGANGAFLQNNGSGTLTWATLDVPGDLTDLDGVLPISQGGTNNSESYSSGSVIFADGTKLTQDNTNFFWDNDNNRLGIGDNSPAAALTVGSGDAFQVNGSGAIAAASGITSSGTITFSGLNTAGAVIYTNSSGALNVTAQGTSGDCLISAGSSTPTWGNCLGSSLSVWSSGNGSIYPTNSTMDFLLGGTATSSAKFAITNMNSGTPVASVSAGTTGATYVTADGNIQTTARQNLALGGSTTGNITFDSYLLTSALPISLADTALNASLTQGVVDSINDVYDLVTTGGGSSMWTLASGVIYPTSATNDFAVGGTTLAASMFGIDESAGNFYFGYDNSANPTFNFEATDNDAGTFGFNTNDAFYFSGANVGIGTTSPTALLDISATQTSGTVFNFDYDVSTVLTGDLIGAKFNLDDGNVTATNQNVTGLNIKLPTVTNTGSGSYSIRGFYVDFGTGSGLNNTGSGTTTYDAARFVLPALTQTTGTLAVNGLTVVTPGTITTGGTATGLNVSATGVGAGSLYGLNIGAITGSSGTEYALNIGSGWDSVLRVNGTQVINGSGVTVEAGGGTGQSTYTTGDILYASAANTLSKLAIGNTDGYVLKVSGGVPTWGTISGSSCSSCVVTNPSATQAISPTADATGLIVRQSNAGSPTADIFSITNNAGSSKYFYVDSSGTVYIPNLGSSSSDQITIEPSTDKFALKLLGTNVASSTLQLIDSFNTSGTIFDIDYPSAKVLGGTLYGMDVDLSTNVTATNQSVYVQNLTLPSVTNTNTTGTKNLTGIAIAAGGGLNQNGSGGTTTFAGLDVTIPALTQTAGTINGYGLNVTTPSAITTGGTAAALNVSASGVGAGTLYGVNVGNITAGAGTERAINIGTGWDYGVYSDTTGANYFAGTVGVGDTTPDALAEILGTTEQLRLSYADGTADARFTVNSSGDFTIDGSTDGTGSQTFTLTGYSTINASSLTTLTTASTLSMASTTTLNCADCIDFDDMADSMTLDATWAIAQGSNQINITKNSGTSNALNYTVSNAVGAGNGVFIFDVQNASTSIPAMLIINAGSTHAFRVNDNGNATDTSPFVVDATGSVGIGDSSPDSKLEVSHTSEQLRLTYTDDTIDARFTVDSSGNLTIDGSSDGTGSQTFNLTGYSTLSASSLSTFTTASTLSMASTSTLNCADCIDFDDMSDSLTLDASTSLTQSTNTWSQTYAGTTGTGYTYTASSLTSGSAALYTTAATAFTGNLVDITSTGGSASNTGTLLHVQSAATNAETTAMITNLGTGISFRVNDQTGDADTTPFVIDASGQVGIGDSTPSSPLQVKNLNAGGTSTFFTSGDWTSSAGGAGVQIAHLSGTTGVAAGLAVQEKVNNAATAVTFAAGVYGELTPQASATEGYGLYGDVYAPAGTSNTHLAAIAGRILTGQNGSTVTNTYGLRIKDFVTLGTTTTMTNTYGAYIGDITLNSGAVTQTNTPYSFYASDANTYNYFAGSTGIGDTTPDALMEILGTTEQLRLTYTDGTVDTRITTDSSGNLTIDGSSDGTGSQTFTLTGYSTLTASSLSTFNCADCIDFDDMEDTLDLDAALTLNQTTNTWSQSFTGTTTTGLTYTASSLTSGKAALFTTAASAFTGNLVDITSTGGSASNTGTLLHVQSAATDAETTAMITNLGTGISFRVNDATGDSDTTPFVIDTSGNVGAGDSTPDALMEILGTTEQLRLTYTDGTVDTRITTDSSGNLTIDGSSDGTGSQTFTLTGYSTLTASSLSTFNCADCIDFDDMEDTLDLDAALTLNQTTNTWSQSFTGTTTTGLTYTASSLTSGTGVLFTSAATALTGNVVNVTSTGGNASNTGSVLRASAAATDAMTTLMVTNLGSGISFRVNDNTGDNDGTPFVVDANGFVGVGNSVPVTELTVASSTSADRGISSFQNNTGAQAAQFSGYKSRGSFSSPSAVTNGDNITAFFAQAYANSTYSPYGGWGYLINGTVTGSTVPTDFIISTGSSVMSAITTNERLRITSTGTVGIGTSSPGGKLEIAQTDAANDEVLYMNTEESTSTQQVWALESDTTNNSQSADTVKAHFNADGSLYISLTGTQTGTAVCHSTDGQSNNDQLVDCTGTLSDYAERHPVDADIDFAEIITAGPNTVVDKSGRVVPVMTRTTKAYQANAIGITSDNFNDFSSIGDNYDSSIPVKPIALNGRVPVKVSPSSAPISRGDFVATSNDPGRAMKATQAGYVIGTALEDWQPGQETVLVFVRNSYYMGEIAQNGTLISPELTEADLAQYSIAKDTTGSFAVYGPLGAIVDRVVVASRIMVAELEAGAVRAQEVTAVNVTTDTLQANSVRIQDLTLAEYIGTVVSDLQAQAATSSANTSASVASTPTIVSTPLTTESVSLGDLDSVATESAQLLKQSFSDITLSDSDITIELAAETVTKYLDVNGHASVRGYFGVGQAIVVGKGLTLSDAGLDFTNAVAASDRVLNILGSGQGTLSILKDRVTITDAGLVTVNGDLEINGRTTFGDADMGGFAKIAAGEQEVTVTFAKPFAVKPVINVTAEDYEGVLALHQVSTNSFTIRLQTVATTEVTLHWTALSLKNAGTAGGQVAGTSVEVTPNPLASPVATPSPSP